MDRASKLGSQAASKLGGQAISLLGGQAVSKVGGQAVSLLGGHAFRQRSPGRRVINACKLQVFLLNSDPSVR